MARMTGPLTCYYLIAATAFAAATWREVRAGRRKWTVVQGTVTGAFLVFLMGTALGFPPGFPQSIKSLIDWLVTPQTVLLGTFAGIAVFFRARKLLADPGVGMLCLGVMLGLFGLALADPNFARNVTRPDNLPIVILVFSLAFFTWVGMAQAVANDDRIGRWRGPIEKVFSRKIPTWPDLVYIELIATLGILTLLIVWSLLVPAPLEPPADPAITPNPAKAPWYFLGLQELLLFADPWYAGVVIPALIILGLIAIPYIDRNPEGSGYYTIERRPFAYLVFLFGFVGLWVLLIVVGTMFRGPNWSFFGPCEAHDPHRMIIISGESLSSMLGMGEAGNAGPLAAMGRESIGLLLTAACLVGVPMLLARTIWKDLRAQLGGWRFYLMAVLLVLMVLVPVRMLLYWWVGLRYFVHLPEIGLGF